MGVEEWRRLPCGPYDFVERLRDGGGVGEGELPFLVCVVSREFCDCLVEVDVAVEIGMFCVGAEVGA